MNDFWPKDAGGWTVLIAFGTGIIIAAWRYAAHVSRQIDGLGSRVNSLNETCIKTGTHYETLNETVGRSKLLIEETDKELAHLTGRHDKLEDEVRDDRLAQMTMMHNNEKAAGERNAQLREQLARIEERLDIRSMVEHVVSKLKAS